MAGVKRPIEVSDPLIEAQYMTGSHGDVVVLINWRQNPIDELVVRFPHHKDGLKVTSLRVAGLFKGHLHKQTQRGRLKVEKGETGAAQVRLRLEVSDYLLIN